MAGSHEPDGREAGAGAVGALEDEITLLARTLEAVQRKRAYPLDRAAYLLLRLIEGQGPQPVGAIARLLLLDDSTATRQVAAMAKAGLLRKRRNPADARSSVVEATARGLAAAAEMRARRLTRIDAMLDGWSEAERRAAAEIVGKLNAALRKSVEG